MAVSLVGKGGGLGPEKSWRRIERERSGETKTKHATGWRGCEARIRVSGRKKKLKTSHFSTVLRDRKGEECSET